MASGRARARDFAGRGARHGACEFKIASADWFEVDLGWYQDPDDPFDTPEVTLGVPKQITRVTCSNLYLPSTDEGV